MAEQEKNPSEWSSTFAGLRSGEAISNRSPETARLPLSGGKVRMKCGVALKAFPESIHVDEPGTILNPTQGEIARPVGDQSSPPLAKSPRTNSPTGTGIG